MLNLWIPNCLQITLASIQKLHAPLGCRATHVLFKYIQFIFFKPFIAALQMKEIGCSEAIFSHVVFT